MDLLSLSACSALKGLADSVNELDVGKLAVLQKCFFFLVDVLSWIAFTVCFRTFFIFCHCVLRVAPFPCEVLF